MQMISEQDDKVMEQTFTLNEQSCQKFETMFAAFK